MLDTYSPPRFGDGLALPHFKREAVKDEEKSEAAGRPIYEDRDFVEFRHPGELKTKQVCEVTKSRLQQWRDDKEKQAYVAAYNRWKETQENTVEGTPLTEWPRMTRSRVMELREAGIVTVEQLASLGADVVDKFKLTKDQQAAQIFLKPENEAVRDLKKENRKLESEVEEMKAQLAQLTKGT